MAKQPNTWTFKTSVPNALLDLLDHITATTKHTRKSVLLIAAREFRKRYPINQPITLPHDNIRKPDRTVVNFHCVREDFDLLRTLGRGNDQIKHQHDAYLKLIPIVSSLNYAEIQPLRRQKRQNYKPAEDQIIIDNWHILTSDQLQEFLPGRTRQSIAHRANRLRLDAGTRQGGSTKGGDSHAIWTIADEKRLVNLASANDNPHHLARELQRTPDSIKWKLRMINQSTSSIKFGKTTPPK